MFLGRVCYGTVSDDVVKYLVMTLKLHVSIKVLPSVHLGVPEDVIGPHRSVGDVFVFEPSRTHLWGGGGGGAYTETYLTLVRIVEQLQHLLVENNLSLLKRVP